MALTEAQSRGRTLPRAFAADALGAVFALTIGLGAALLFGLEPMAAKMALPLLGGSSEVWTTALVFFQVMLLAGYCYAHLLRSFAGTRLQVAVHFGLIVLAAASLPIHVVADSGAGPDRMPIVALVRLLAVAVGLPFFVLSATSSLVQSWFVRATGGARDPYVLYAAGNFGSLAALLAYPFVVEPLIGTAAQSRLWASGYVCFCVALAACAWTALRGEVAPSRATAHEPKPSHPKAYRAMVSDAAPSPLLRLRLRWIALAAVPSSLMMGATTQLSTAIAPIPLLWVLPLALYLLSFVVAFSQGSARATALAIRAVPYSVLPLVLLLMLHATLPFVAYIALHLVALFVLALACHGTLAALRPDPERLTGFYLWLSAGGALGGLFNAVVAPLVFPSVTEYPLAVVCALLLLVSGWNGDRNARALDFAVPAALGIALLAAARAAALSNDAPPLRYLEGALAVGLAFSTVRRPLRFALTAGALLVASALAPAFDGRTLALERNFFGVKQVLDDPTGGVRILVHGGTYHGKQSLDPRRAREPLMYYTRTGPLGDVFAEIPARAGRRVAVVGLGIGTIACYRAPGEDWQFYEIDAAVERLARDPAYFSFLSRCAPEVPVVIGDARLSLARAPRKNDLLILDAYSSDNVPVHLLTREALRVYLANLAPEGVLAFHISSRYFTLRPVLANAASDARLPALVRSENALSVQAQLRGNAPSEWLVMARDKRAFGPLANDSRWHEPAKRPDLPLWTDDYSSLVRVLHW